jgi:hypothetical protein
MKKDPYGARERRKSLVISGKGGPPAVLTPIAAPWGADYSLLQI